MHIRALPANLVGSSMHFASYQRPIFTSVQSRFVVKSQRKAFSASSVLRSKMSSSDLTQPFLEAMYVRRSQYTLSPESTISDARIKEILETTLDQAPSTFASFTTRLVLVVKEEHTKLWDEIINVMDALVDPNKSQYYNKQRMNSFQNAYGTVLFFEDTGKVAEMCKRSPWASKFFPVWSQHTSAIHQQLVWTALATSGMGASLQHYNAAEEKLKGLYGLPEGYELVAQMPFGKPAGPPRPKPVADKPMEERLRVFGV